MPDSKLVNNHMDAIQSEQEVRKLLAKHFEMKRNVRIRYNADDGSIDVNGSVKFLGMNRNAYDDDESIFADRMPVTFRKVKGNFQCRFVRTLEGCPQIVGGCFDCSLAPITSLRGGPLSVGSLHMAPPSYLPTYECSNTDIVDLVGAPRHIPGDFYCHNNLNLKSLRGGPDTISGGLVIWSRNNETKIRSLEGLPKIGGTLRLDYQTDLGLLPIVGTRIYFGMHVEDTHPEILKATKMINQFVDRRTPGTILAVAGRLIELGLSGNAK